MSAVQAHEARNTAKRGERGQDNSRWMECNLSKNGAIPERGGKQKNTKSKALKSSGYSGKVDSLVKHLRKKKIKWKFFFTTARTTIPLTVRCWCRYDSINYCTLCMKAPLYLKQYQVTAVPHTVQLLNGKKKRKICDKASTDSRSENASIWSFEASTGKTKYTTGKRRSQRLSKI